MGDLIAVLSAVLFSFTNVLVRKGTTSTSKDNGVFVSIVLTAAISGLCVLVLGLINGFPRFTLEGTLWFAGAGFMTAFLGRILQYASIQHLGSVRAAAMKRLIPFYAVVLGALLLGEPITFPLVIGMICIFTGILMVIAQSFRAARTKQETAQIKQETAASAETPATAPATAPATTPATAPATRSNRIKAGFALIGTLGFFYGPAAALAYSLGYIARKKGLLEIADPFTGAMLGGATGVILFAVMALFQEKYRYSVAETFRTFKPWLFFAGVANSLGQISYFFALQLSAVTRVSLISSLEVFITMFLSVWIFKTREQLTLTVIIACIISTIGAAVIILG